MIVLALNILVSWLIGKVFKESLLALLSEQIYYQTIVFISLTIAPTVSVIYAILINTSLKNKERDIINQLNPDVINSLKGEEKKYAESLMNPSIEISEKIRKLKSERESFENSR